MRLSWEPNGTKHEASRIEIFKEHQHVIPGACWVQLCSPVLKLLLALVDAHPVYNQHSMVTCNIMLHHVTIVTRCNI